MALNTTFKRFYRQTNRRSYSRGKGLGVIKKEFVTKQKAKFYPLTGFFLLLFQFCYLYIHKLYLLS